MEGHARIERWSLLMHRRIAERLEQGDEGVLAIARRNLARWQHEHGRLTAAQAEWIELLAWPAQRLAALLRDAHDPDAVRLRSNSPFAGALDAASRLELLREARAA